MIQRTLLFLCSALMALGMLAQTITVTDQETGAPLPGVIINRPGDPTIAITDARGRADITPFPDSDSLLFQLLGYQSALFTPAMLAGLDHRVSLRISAIALGEYVVSANRWEQERERVPDQITVMRPRDVAFQNPGTAADMLQQSGEVFVQKSQLGGGSPMLRGFAANRILIVVDGVRMNNAIYRAGNLQNVIGVDPNALERAEVIHGPGAMTYGSDAIGGVMDFHLLDPRFSSDSSLLTRGNAMLRYASAANELGTHLNFGLGGKKLAFVGSGSFSSFDDLRMGSDGPDDLLRPWYVETFNGVDSQVVNTDPELQVGSGFDNMQVMGKLAWRPKQQLQIGANAYYSTTSDVPRYDRLIELRNGEPRSAEWFYGPQEWVMASLQVEHQAEQGPWSKLRFSLAYQNYTESRNDRNFGSGLLRTQRENVSGIWSNLDLEKGLSKRTQLLYGAEWITNNVASAGERVDRNTGELEVMNSRYPDGSSWSTMSLYAGMMHDLNERTTLSAGVRVNRSALEAEFDTTLFPYPALSTSLENSALSGNLGGTWRPGKGWKLGVDLSTGFRAPNIDDIGKVFDSEPGAVIVPNPYLEPEYAYTLEGSIEKVFHERVRIRGNAFYTLLDNAMVRRPFELDGQDSILFEGELSRVDAIQNAAQARVVGFVLGLDADLGRGFGTSVRYNWQDGVEQDDDSVDDVPLRHAPPPFGRFGISWQRKTLRTELFTRFSAGFTYDELPPSEQGKPTIYAKDPNGNPFAPSWYSLDLNISYGIGRYLQLSGGVENITDQRYRPYSSGITAPGRNIIMALRVRF